MSEINFKIVDHIAILSTNKSGWTKEVNLISWNNASPKYDIRDWAPDHDKMSKGITLTKEELDVFIQQFK